MKKICTFRNMIIALLLMFSLSAFAKVNKEFVIVIQAGHGATDQGARAKDGTLEKDLTLAYALELQKIAKANNFRVVMCREDDTYFDNGDRAEFIKKNNADVFISLHFNFNPNDATEGGMECYVADKNLLTENRILGKFIGAELYRVEGMRFKGVNLTVLKNIGLNDMAAPAAMVELGYMSNDNDLAFIKTEAGKKDICEKLLHAIMRYKIQIETNK